MSSQRGFALAAAMMVAALLCVLGISAVQSTTLEVHLSARDRDARAALYLAEAGLEEARYYAARGWGKIEPVVTRQVRVTTPPAGPADFWDGSRYKGFTLVDGTGGHFTIQAHTGGADPVITTTSGDPSPGRFVVLRQVPGTTDPRVTWDAVSSELRVEDPGWALGTSEGLWNGWFLWNPAGQAFEVLASGASAPPDRVWMRLSTDPGPGPFRLALHPWVAALARGNPVPGDGNAATTAWDRAFGGGGGGAAGEAAVEAELVAPGRYRLVSTGMSQKAHRRVSLTLSRAGLPEQRLGDWRAEDEP